MQEGSQAAMPMMSNYLSEWKGRMEKELKDLENDAPKVVPITPAPKN